MEPLEDRHVGVGNIVVGVDARVGEAGERLIVARIGEVQPVGHLRIRTQIAVAEDLALVAITLHRNGINA
jgi:hypothetical protein